MRLLLLILRWQTQRVRRVAERLDAQLEAPVLKCIDRQLVDLLAGTPGPCPQHAATGCPITCDDRPRPEVTT